MIHPHPESNKQTEPSTESEYEDVEFSVARCEDPSISACFRFSDDVWYLLDLLQPHQPTGQATFNFESLPQWLRREAKFFIHHEWRELGTSLASLIQQLVALRHLGIHLPNFPGQPIELRSREARAFSRTIVPLGYSSSTYSIIQGNLNRFVRYVRARHPDVHRNDFQIQLPKEVLKQKARSPFNLDESDVVATEVKAMILDACAAEVEAYRKAKQSYVDPVEQYDEYRSRVQRLAREAKREGEPGRGGRSAPTLRELLGRAVKAQVVALAVCVGRRAASLANTPEYVRLESGVLIDEEGQSHRGVWIRFRELKIRDVDEDVFCPGAYGDIAVKVIETARELTAELRGNNPAWAKYLFLVPALARKSARVVGVAILNNYLNGHLSREEKTGEPRLRGRPRSNQPSSSERRSARFGGMLQRYGIPGHITTHAFRGTRATNLWTGGMSIQDVQYDLGHVTPAMTVRHYIAGTEESKRRFEEQARTGALRDSLVQLVGGRQVVNGRLNRKHVEIMQRQGRIVRATRYGYCTLPGTSGACVTGNPCYIGSQGDACDYSILSPDAIPALREDLEVVEFNLVTYASDPDYRAFVANQELQGAIIKTKLDEALTLRENLV